MTGVIFMENITAYTPMSYHLIQHVLTLGYASMFAALLYFWLTKNQNAPKYRTSSILSVVVMTSAALLLFAQDQAWSNAFALSEATGLYERVGGSDLFTNGYRYLNWLIDVPMLLFQILFVVTITKDVRNRYRNQFFFSGPMMIITGYIGQFYETTQMVPFLVWGAISTVFFFHVLILIRRVIVEGNKDLSAGNQKLMNSIWWIFLISWFLYPGGYLFPIVGGLDVSPEWAVVGRQITFTVADIASKIIYGVLLNVVSTNRSVEEGYVESAAA